MSDTPSIKAEVISVFPDRVKISVGDVAAFANGGSLKVGSYLRITDTEDAALIAVIENFCLEVSEKGERKHVIEALPLGLINDGKFERAGDALTTPPQRTTSARFSRTPSIRRGHSRSPGLRRIQV